MKQEHHLDQIHGLEFFDKLLIDRNTIKDYFLIDTKEAANYGLYFDEETLKYYEIEWFEGEPEIIYVDHYKRIKSALNYELKKAFEFIDKKFTSLLRRDEKEAYLEQIVSILIYLNRKAHGNQNFKSLKLNEKVFEIFALKLYQRYTSFITHPDLIKKLDEFGWSERTVNLPINLLAEQMGESKWKLYEEYFYRLKVKKRNLQDLARHIRVELPDKGYLDVSPSAERTTKILESITGKKIYGTTSAEKYKLGNEIKLDPPLPSIKDRK